MLNVSNNALKIQNVLQLTRKMTRMELPHVLALMVFLSMENVLNDHKVVNFTYAENNKGDTTKVKLLRAL